MTKSQLHFWIVDRIFAAERNLAITITGVTFSSGIVCDVDNRGYRLNMAVTYAKILSLVAMTTAVQAGFYADNGLDRTISYRSLPKQEKREMENEILNLLGLDRRPKPKIHQTSNSAPKYLIDLYNQVDLEAEEKNTSFRDVDFVISFVNHHNNLEDEQSIEPKLRFDVSDISPQETVMHAALNLYRRNTRSAQAQPEAEPDTSEDAQPSSAYMRSPQIVPAESVHAILQEKQSEESVASSLPTPVKSTTSSTTASTSLVTPIHDQNTVESTIRNKKTSTSSTSIKTSHCPSTTSSSVTTTTGSSIPESPQNGPVSTSEATQAKLRHRRMVSPSLDYPDGFAFFDQPFEIQVFCMRHGSSIGDIALEPVTNYTVATNETGWIQLNATNPLLNWVSALRNPSITSRRIRLYCFTINYQNT